ncbi:MAG TPA: hypothetical protein VF631_08585 [Allosphingosinicella sp.]|jgi:hypothetical protein|uniref:hypothetical protein n=1 Tax=Allosphingosinicella sp. TaxID=2823234 RepID=UPI002F298435
MTRSATDVMQDILFAAVIDGVVALKAASKGLPNTLLRDLNAIHANTTLADLPPELQASIQASLRAAFTRLLKEGYSVSPGQPAPTRSPPGPRDGPRDGPRPATREGPRDNRRPPPRREPGGPNRPQRPGPRGGRPPRKPTS